MYDIINYFVTNVKILQSIPFWMVQAAFMLAGCGAVLGVAALFAGVGSVVERNIAGRIQARYGPNRVGPWGWMQFLADGIKLVLKEDLIPDASAKMPFRLAPYFIFTVAFAAFIVVPFSQKLQIADLNIGILYIISVSSIVVIAILLAGWSSGNKWSLFGAMRSAAQIISYEVPVTITILAVIMMAGTMSMQEITAGQSGGIWRWFIFRYPLFTIPAFLVYYIASIAEVNRTPFDIPEAESELVAGYHTEYSSMRFAMFMMSEYVNVLAVSAIAVTMFLGGWQSPYPGHIFPGIWSNIEGLFWFFSKTFFLVFLMMWIRWTLPRYRVDQLMDLCWKVLLPVSFINLFGICAWMLLA
ncbi:MAG: NADH-quinone oxidoreductase subunit NuoH [Planctomycetes bacterium]|nr:NADH-quinone oxidoreductase subunit NuoH [Planctomycetota bacterium]